MPVVPKSSTRGYPGFVYLAWHSKLAGRRVTRTVGQAKADTGMNLGNSFCYLKQCRGGEQSGPKRSLDSAYRIAAIPDLNEYLERLTSKHVAETLGLPERQVLSWRPDPVAEAAQAADPEPASRPRGRAAAHRGAPAEPTAQEPAAPVAARRAEPAAAAGLSAEKLEDLLQDALQPVVATLSVLEQGQRQLREQLEKLERAERTAVQPVPQARSVFSQERGAPKLEEALVTMLGMLRDLPERLVAEQTEKLMETLRSEGKHTGRGLRGLRETLEFQHREITSILAKVADSLTRVVSARDANLQVLINTLHSALSLVPELPEDHPLNLPAALPSQTVAAGPEPGLVQPRPTDSRNGSE